MKRQSGFLIPQLLIVLTVLSVVGAFYGNREWRKYADGAVDNRARLVGTTLAAIGDAAKDYSTEFYSQIRAGTSVTRNGYTVAAANVAQPTVADLKGLGFLRTDAPSTVNYGNTQTIGFVIQFTPADVSFVARTNAPLLDERHSNAIDLRRINIAASAASKVNSGVSIPSAAGGNPSIFVGAGGTQIATNTTGTAGLVALRDGYASQGLSAFLRRDGTLPMTGDLNLQDTAGGKHNINNVAGVNAISLATSSDANVGGEVYSGGWFRTRGTNGWYNEAFNGGWYMSDTTWVRSYADKNVYTGGEMQATTVRANTRTVTGDLVINAIGAVGGGCAVGSFSRDTSGNLLSCVNGAWKSGGSMDVQYVMIGQYYLNIASGVNNYGKALLIMASDGSLTCGNSNAVELLGYMNGQLITREYRSGAGGSDYRSITFIVPAGASWAVTSNPWNCGSGNIAISAATLG